MMDDAAVPNSIVYMLGLKDDNNFAPNYLTAKFIFKKARFYIFRPFS